MSQVAGEFVRNFVLPMLCGGTVSVGRPLRPKDRDALAVDPATLRDRDLLLSRLRRAEALTPHPALGDPDHDELSLWTGLHNTLLFDHPDRGRVWTRASTWRRAEGATRTMLTLPFPSTLGEGLARHVSVGAFIELRRVDRVVATAAGKIRYLGQQVPRRRFGLGQPPPGSVREETVTWLAEPHAPETHRLVEDAMRASPLTCLLNPLLAPPGWSPLWASEFLRNRAFARAVCHHWATQADWVATGGAVMSALMPSLPQAKKDRAADVTGNAEEDEETTGGSPLERRDQGEDDRPTDADPITLRPRPRAGPLALPGAVIPAGPESLAAVASALIHLHFLKVLELDARLGVAFGSRDPGILWFLALPLLLPWLGKETGTPLGGLPAQAAFEASAQRRWTEYTDHLEELVPRPVVENLLATLVPAIVKPS